MISKVCFDKITNINEIDVNQQLTWIEQLERYQLGSS